MEIMEDGNLMDRVPILLQRDLEYYQKNQTVLSETVCRGVVGGRLDFPRNASYAAVKLVIWLEEEFVAAFGTGSGLFNNPKEEENPEGIVRSSDSDKFVSLTIQSADLLLEHLHILVQEALDHADLPVLTSALGAAALIKNSLHCYINMSEESGSSERNASLQACYKRYATMSEAVAERMLDLHVRLLSLYLLQDAGGRPIDNQDGGVPESGSASVQGWWLYMQGSKQDLWETVPPRMAQRIFAGMLNETLTIFTVRYCQANTNEDTTRLLINDILNMLLCLVELVPAVCGTGSDLLGLQPARLTRDVRDIHAKCNELFKCLVFRGAELHFIHKAFKDTDTPEHGITERSDQPSPWFTLVNPHLIDDSSSDLTVTSTQQLSKKTAVAVELKVLMAQPQPSWSLLVKVLMMRTCFLAELLIKHGVRHMSKDNAKWLANGLWFSMGGTPSKCGGFLCTLDGFCKSEATKTGEEEYSRAVGALTYVLVSIGSKDEVRSTLLAALEVSGRDWAACLDRRQVWCDRRPAWLAAILSTVGTTLQAIPASLVNAVHTGATMYQAMSLCLAYLSRLLSCLPSSLLAACSVLQEALPSHVTPVGGSMLLQMLVTVLYEELQLYAAAEADKEKASTVEQNGEPHGRCKSSKLKGKHVRIAGMGHLTLSSVSLDGSASSIALAVAEALCSIDEGHKHTQQIQQLVQQASKPVTMSDQFGLEDFPEFAKFAEEGKVPGANAERASDASALTGQLLMSSAGRDSLRVIYEHLLLHEDRVYKELGVNTRVEGEEYEIPLRKAPLLYTMFHIGRRPFDQYLRGEWQLAWSAIVMRARNWSGVEGARAHVTRRADVRAGRAYAHYCSATAALADIRRIFSTPLNNVL